MKHSLAVTATATAVAAEVGLIYLGRTYGSTEEERRARLHIVPELQDIDVGTFIPDGPPETECGLHVVSIEPGHHRGG